MTKPMALSLSACLRAQVIFAFLTLWLVSCGFVSKATKNGIKPIVANTVEAFVQESDLEIARASMLANMKLVEGIAKSYPDDRDVLNWAAMVRTSYAFAFLQDELELAELAFSDDEARADDLRKRTLQSYARGQEFALQSLRLNKNFKEGLNDQTLEACDPAHLKSILRSLTQEDATSLFWLSFAWGARLQIGMIPEEITALPKIELLVGRLLEIDEKTFYGIGPNLLAGVFYGFRTRALGGDPDRALHHFRRASELGKQLLPKTLAAQYVHAQKMDEARFEKDLTRVIYSAWREEYGLLETLAKRKACRLLAHADELFLREQRPIPRACTTLLRPAPLRRHDIQFRDEAQLDPRPPLKP